MSDTVLNQIKQAIETIKFGSVEIVIHDSRVVQIERKEKVRFQSDNPKSADRTSGSSDNKKREDG